MDKQIIYHVTAPMSEHNGHFQWFWVQKNGTLDAQIQKRRPLRLLFQKNIIFGRDKQSDLDFENCPDMGAVTW